MAEYASGSWKTKGRVPCRIFMQERTTHPLDFAIHNTGPGTVTVTCRASNNHDVNTLLYPGCSVLCVEVSSIELRAVEGTDDEAESKGEWKALSRKL